MESVTTFVEIFKRNWIDRNGEELKRIFKEAPRYFREVPPDKIGLLLELLLEGPNGLLRFLENEINHPKITQHFEGALREGFAFVEFLIRENSNHLNPYLVEILRVCIIAAEIKTGYFIKRAACRAFVALIKKFPKHPFEVDQFVKKFVKSKGYYKPNELLLILEVLSTIARYCPDNSAVKQYGSTLQTLIVHTFNKMYDNIDKHGTANFQILLECLANILYYFPVRDTSSDRKLYDQIKTISMIIQKDANSSRDMIETILQFMIQLMSKFGKLIRNDHQYWHNFFFSYSENEMFDKIAMEAIRVYYEVLATVLNKENSQENCVILQSLQENFIKALTSEHLNSPYLRINIIGYSHMAEPLKKFANDSAVEEMFFLIAQRTLPLYFSEEDAQDRFEDIADYQEALAKILVHISYVTMDQIRILIKLCTLMIKRFPELTSSSQRYAAASLRRTIGHVSRLKVYFYNEFMSSIIYDGIIWSCSHSLSIDAELKRDLEHLKKRPISYKDYLPLWESLLDPENYTNASDYEKIMNESLKTCTSLSSKLDLRIKSRQDNVFSNMAISQIPENEADFRIFLNMVDLYDEILEKLIDYSSTDDVYKFTENLIKASNKHPLLSGFYRLIKRVLQSESSYNNLKKLDKNTYNLVSNYLTKILDLIFKFSHELQVSCIQLVLHAPKAFLDELIKRVPPVFQLGFKIGLNDFELANNTLDALEKFLTCDNTYRVNELLAEILPSLELYLKSEESWEIHDESEKRMKNTKDGLQELQNRILLFFGRAERGLMRDFLHQQSQNTGGTWDKKDLLEYAMPLPDGNLSIHLDSILPRIIELSLDSSDRRTRISACEFLHSVVTIILGKTVQYLSAEADRYAEMYKLLCPVLLRLGCDTDEVVEQLFNPLMLQITHWVSSKLMLHSPVVGFLVECLFDGLCDGSNSLLRDFSGICLAEFAKWSIRQASDADLSKKPGNIGTIVDHMRNSALHPLKYRRVAAAIAFNHLYRILREHEAIVSMFWLEFLHCFVKSIDGCDDERIKDAIDHVARVLLEKPDIFHTTSGKRRIPEEFADGTLEGSVNWLLANCVTLDDGARKKTMELFQQICDKIDGKGPAKRVIAECITTMDFMNLILKGLDDPSFIVCGEKVRQLLRSIDIYIWLLQGDLVEADLLFSESNSQRKTIFYRIEQVVTEINQVSDLKCKIVLKIFEFADVISSMSTQTEIHGILFNDNFFTLLSGCILNPDKLHFDERNSEMTEILYVQIQIITNQLQKILTIERFSSLTKILEPNITCDSNLFFTEDCESDTANLHEKTMKSLLLLKQCNLLEKLSIHKKISEEGPKVVEKIFNKLKIYMSNKCWCTEVTEKMGLYFGNLLQLLWTSSSFSTLVRSNAIEIDAPLLSGGRATITHGEYFFTSFRNTLIPLLLEDVKNTLKTLVDMSQQNPDFSLFILSDIACWLLKCKKDYKEICQQFANAAIDSFVYFERSVNNLNKRKKLLKNIYRTLVRFRHESTSIKVQCKDLYVWILKELQDSPSISEKTQVLSDFLICLVDDSSDENMEVNILLKDLKNLRGGKTADELLKNSLESTKIMECFQTLTAVLSTTKSIIVLEAVVNFAMGIGKFACNKATDGHLASFFRMISDLSAVDCLNKLYRMFMDTTVPTERFDVLQYFLLPAFKYCAEFAISTFFEKNIGELASVIYQEVPDNTIDKRQVYISKIGTYNLFELMFIHLNLEMINNSTCPIATKIIEKTKSDTPIEVQILKNTLNMRQLKVDEPDAEIKRLLHCAAFNCRVTIVSVCKEEKYFAALFAENPSKNEIIWENIIDCTKKYSLTQTFKEYPEQRKILVNIKQNLKKKQVFSSNYSYIKSYNLASSTLTEDIYAYDMSEVILLEKPATQKLSLTLEIDDLNEHECMASICGILTYMVECDLGVSPKDTENPPKWLLSFLGATTINEPNIKLFLLKIILNNQEIFKPIAQLFLGRTISVISSLLKEFSISYITADALLMLIDWADVAVPDEKLRDDVNEMFSLLVDKVDAESSTEYIAGYNYSIIEMLVKVWHKVLNIPKCLSAKMSKKPDRAVKLILIFLANNLEKELIENPKIIEFLVKHLENWKEKEEAVLHTCEAIGLFLKFAEQRDNSLEIRRNAIAVVRRIFGEIGDPNRLVKCVHAMCKACPNLLEEFFTVVTHHHLKLTPATMAKSMEVLLQRIPALDEEEITHELNYMRFQDLLKNKVLSCEKICLQIIQSLVGQINAEDFLPLAKLAANYAEHDIQDYREIVYNISIRIFTKYNENISEDECVQSLIDLSKRILLSGLLDPSETLHQKVLTFWTEEIELSTNSHERLLNILDNYSPGVEKNFLPIIAILFLSLCKKSPIYDTKLFTSLDRECNYQNYKIATTWRMKHLSYKIPMFIPSYAAECSQRFTLSSLSSSDFVSTDGGLMIRATNPLEFEPTLAGTYVADRSESTPTDDDVFAVPATPIKKLSRRFLHNWKYTNALHRQSDAQIRQTREEILKQQTIKQRSSVKLSRSYRIGDLPDIEISHETIVNPLLELIKKDQQTCRNFVCLTICALMEKLQNDRSRVRVDCDEFMQKIADKFNFIFKHHRGDGILIFVILEIMLKNTGLNFNRRLVAHVSKNTGLSTLGTLLLERSLTFHPGEEEPQPKRRRELFRTGDTAWLDDWIDLGELYESINDVDVVLSVFKNHIPRETVNAASTARSERNWEKAKLLYEKACNEETGLIFQHCQRGYFECLARLSDWDTISSTISDNHENCKLTHFISSTNSPEIGWLTPWYFKSHLYKFLTEGISHEDKFHTELEILLKDPNTKPLLEDLFIEELAVIFAPDTKEQANELMLLALKKVKDRWAQLCPLSVQLRLQEVTRLQGLHNVDIFRKALLEKSNINSVLYKLWTSDIPSFFDDLLPWDMQLSYRSHFAEILVNKLKAEAADDRHTERLCQRIQTAMILPKMRLINSAYNQQNVGLMRKYMNNIRNKHWDIVPEQLESEFELNIAEIKFLRGKLGDRTAKLQHFEACKRRSHILHEKPDVKDDTRVANCYLDAEWSLAMIDLKRNDEEAFSGIIERLRENHSFPEVEGAADPVAALDLYSLERLKEAIRIADFLASSSHLHLLEYCCKRIEDGNNSDNMIQHFVESTLQAISLDALEASRYFPCILREDYLEKVEIREIFEDITANMPSRHFLQWQAQLFRHLTSPLEDIVKPIIMKIATDYPNAILHTLQVTCDTKPELMNNPTVAKLFQQLLQKNEFQLFTEAMEYLVQPELYLKYYLDDLLKNLSSGVGVAVDKVIKKVYRPTLSSMQGDLYKRISQFKDEIQKIREMSQSDVQKHVANLAKRLDANLQRRNKKDSTNLKDYSPYLSQLNGTNLEIPGLYIGKLYPQPNYHPKIVKIEPKIQVMKSLRKPIKITMIGSNTKSYSFLVKFGEDLRLDERVEQTFGLMNQILRYGLPYSHRHLSINTYKVIPLSASLGLIEWVSDTKTLWDCVEFSLNAGQRKSLLSLDSEYEEWISACSPDEGRRSVKYKEALLKYPRQTAVDKMEGLIGKTDTDALRRTFVMINPSSESFMFSRRNFITSYAVMCTVQWLLGIGDRHLENTLIGIGSGRCTGIDFASAFGGAIDQAIPELTPFRLTNQISSLMKPFSASDLFALTMTYILKALRENARPIVDTLDVVVYENLNWIQYARKFTEESPEGKVDVTLRPKKKIEIVGRKLKGENPADTMVDELNTQHGDLTYFAKYKAVVRGSDNGEESYRGKLKNQFLTANEQVQCLLEQATDLNVLARTHAGWRPWL